MPLTVEETRERLRELELFRECSHGDLDRVAGLASREARFAPGERLFAEGDPARDCYVIVDGEAEVTVAGRFLSSVGEGESVGEMGLLDQGPRTATVVARTPVTVQVIDAGGFDRLLDETPSVTRALLRQVSRRLAASNETVARLASLRDETTVRVSTEAVAADTPGAERPLRIGLDPTAPGFFENPYPQYAALREYEPARYDEAQGTWLISRYGDVLAFGRNRELSVELQHAAPSAYVDQERERLARMAGRQTKMMFRRDPPDHTRLRRQIYQQFTPKSVRRLRPRLQGLVDASLDRLAAKGETDLIADFAFPLPLMVISEMLGMPRGDDAQIRSWSQDITKGIDPSISEAEMEASIAASDAMTAYMVEVIAAKRRAPADDLLSLLTRIADAGDELSEEELVDQLVGLYIAGHETTVNLIGNGTLALLRQRDQLERLRLDPALDANAVEELLRYDSPAQFTRRITRDELEIQGVRIPPGSVIFASLGAANRDPERWGPDADSVDVARRGANEHVSFGGGIHHCLGASLVRLEGQVALGSLVRRFPGMELAAEPRWRANTTLRGLTELRLSLGV
ncbi:MAG: cytochrome P450 [Myxococcota bacterium]|nr:cytochrome P450 [Myxococcota bacterium]